MSRQSGRPDDTESEVTGPAAAGAGTAEVRPKHARHQTDPGGTWFDVRGVRSRLVGRDRELDAMRQVLTAAVDFHAPQLVTIVGNQGTGKSRLVAEHVLREVAAPTRVFHGHAREGGDRHAAIATLLADRFRIEEGDTGDEARTSFVAEVERVFGEKQIAEVLHFLGGFLDLHFPDSPFLRLLDENPAQHDEIARTILRRFIETDAEDSPLVLAFDDLQWADDDTLMLLRELGTGLGGSPVMLIACARPEMLVRRPDWGTGATDHLRIDLRNLEPEHTEAMFRNLLSRCDAIPEDIVEDAVEMTGGNPYFIEQLVRLFLANGTIDASGPRWRLDPDRALETELPISVEEAIEARIAALEKPEREALERGAVFGNVFWLGAVVALNRIEAARPTEEDPGAPPPLPPPGPLQYAWTAKSDPVRRDTEAIIAELVERDYLLELGVEHSTVAGDMELVFKHNLERELIVKSTEAPRLERYYRLAAQWLETRFITRSEEQLELIGHLYERGGDTRRAARCYIAGGDKARARFANEEAVTLYQRGIDVLDDDDAVARLDALHNYGDVLDRVGRTEEAVARFTEMLRHAWLYDNQNKAGAAQSRLGRIHRQRGEYDLAMQHLREASELFTRADDTRGIAGTLDDIGKVHWLRGAYGQALEFHRQALSIRRALGDQRSIALSLANIGRVHHDSGGFKAAIAQFREALDLRREIGDRSGVVASLCDLGGVHLDDGNYDVALELFREAKKNADETGDKLAQADVLSHIGECLSAMGRGSEAVAYLADAIELAESLSDRVALAECHRRLAEVHLQMRELREASTHARKALAIAEGVGSRVHIGSSHRVLAETIAAHGSDRNTLAQAEEHFRRAVDILAGMKSEVELARCYRAYAVLRDKCGLPDDAAKLRKRADEIFGRLRGAASIQ